MLNKKSQGLPASILDFIAFLVLTIVIMLVIIAFALQAKTQQVEIQETTFENENQQFFINLLKTEVNLESLSEMPSWEGNKYLCCDMSSDSICCQLRKGISTTDYEIKSSEQDCYNERVDVHSGVVGLGSGSVTPSIIIDLSFCDSKEQQTNTNIFTLVSLWFYEEEKYKDKLRNNIEAALNDHFGGKAIFALEANHPSLRSPEKLRNAGEPIFEDQLLFETELQVPLLKEAEYIENQSVDLTLKVYIGKLKKDSKCWFMIPKLYERKRCAFDDSYTKTRWLCGCKWIGYKGLFWSDCIECNNGCDEENNVCN